MRKLIVILFLFVASTGIAQDSTYLPDKYFLTNWLHKSKLDIMVNRYTQIKPIRIKGNLYMIPNKVYLENKELIESRINLNKCVIRRVKKSELIESELN